MLRRFLYRFCNPDTGTQGGVGTSPNPQPPTPNPDILTGLQRLIEKQSGDAGRVAELLYRENYDLREKNRQLAGQVPGQGAVVLDATQAGQWTAYQQLGKAEELKAAIDARAAAEAKLTQLERGAVLRQVQDVSGYKASVLAQLPGAADLTFSMREVEADGKKVSSVYVKDPTGAESLLADYAQRHWADFLPALTTTQTQQGTPFVRQSVGAVTPSNPVDQFIRQTNERRAAGPSPLTRK